jgi:hypothetical protein
MRLDCDFWALRCNGQTIGLPTADRFGLLGRPSRQWALIDKDGLGNDQATSLASRLDS